MYSSPLYDEIWEDALKRYEKYTKTAIQVHISDDDTPNSLLQKMKGDFAQFRDKGKHLRNKMKPVLCLVGLFAELAGEAVGTKYPPGKAIFAGIRVLLEASKSVNSNYDSIVEMFEYIDEFLGRLEVHNKHKITDPVKKIIIEFLAQLLSVIGLTTMLIKEGRMKRYFKSLIREDNDVKEAMAKLDRLTKQEDRMVSSVTLSVVNTILAILEEQMRSGKEEIISIRDIISNEIRRLSGTVDQIHDVISNKDRGDHDKFVWKVQEWLSPPDPSTNHNNASELRHKETGKWLLKGHQYTSWKKTLNSFLWIHGRPGSGKTILSSTIIEDLKQERGLNPSLALAYFYHDFRNPKKLLVRNLLCSLIIQLSRCHSTPPNALKKLYDNCRKGSEQPSYESLIMALHEISGLFHHTYIVVDALDECKDPERSSLLHFITSVCAWGLGSVHLLVTSRPEPDIQQRLFSGVAVKAVDLEATIVNQDILRYIRTRLDREEQFGRWRDAGKKLIEEKLTEGAHGVFRWVACQLDALKKCHSSFRALKLALSSLPKTLGETYERILVNIDDADVPIALRILRWLSFTTSPLTLEEIAFAAMIDVDDDDPFNDDNRLQDPLDVLKICSGLITMTTSHGTCYVQLIHFSVKEYLVMERPQSASYNQRFDFSAEVSQVFICRSCFAILLQLINPEEDLFEIDIPLVSYAAEHWTHVPPRYLEESPLLLESVKALFRRDSPQFNNWIRLYCLSDPDDLDTSENDTRLYWTSFFGLVEVSRFLIMDGEDINARKELWGTPLRAASCRGHEEIVRLLLGNSADVNAQGGCHGSALQAASAHGHEKVVRLLLENGADVNAQEEHYETALQAASLRGYEGIVRLLLENGADVNTQGGFHGTALQVASSFGHERIVRLLLENGAGVNAQGGHNGSALQAVSSCGYEKVVRLLLENSADVDAQEIYHGTALHAASFYGHEKIVQLLLEHGADIDAQEGYHGTALQAASSNGQKGIVRLLLKNGADVNAQGGHHGTALQAASSSGREEIVRLLLENGADANAKSSGYHGTALQAALSNGRREIVRLFL